MPERTGSRSRTFDVAGRSRTGVSIPGSEHLALSRAYPRLGEVDVYLGLPTAVARGLQAGSLLTGAVARVEPVKQLAEGVLERVVKGSTGGPGQDARARTRSWAVAETFDDTGRVLTSVTLGGVDPYDFTAAILGWGAQTALDGGLLGTGALGPVDAFGLDALTAGAANAGFSR